MNAQPAEVFAPGDFIREELETRGWTQQDFASILGRPLQTVNQIIRGKKEITPVTAKAIGEAFGTSSELWLSLESAYRLARSKGADPGVARRSRLHSLVPVNELKKRGWIADTRNLDRLEDDIRRLLEIESIDDDPRMDLVARRTDDRKPFSPGQMAWAFWAKRQAGELKAPRYNRVALKKAAPALPRLSVEKNQISRIRDALSELGVRLVTVPHLPSTKIDGAMFWLNASSPVVALSMRFDRIDSFWFTLMHELAHVLEGPQGRGTLDTDLVGGAAGAPQPKSKREREADNRAARWLIPQATVSRFIRNTKPYYSAGKVRAFADDLGIHPGIVVGRLHHAGEIPWKNLRGMLDRVAVS